MPRSINNVTIAGYITEPKRFGGGPVRLSINTGGWKKKDGSKVADCWHRIIVWPNQCPEVDSLEKGQYIAVHGRINYPAFNPNGKQSLEDWVKYGNFCEIVAAKVEVEARDEHDQRPEHPEPFSQEITDDQIPF